MNNSYNNTSSYRFNKRPGKFGRGEFKKGGDPRMRGSKGGITLYEAVCAQCQKETMVPFIPNGSKPVYCRECMEKERHQGSTGRYQFNDSQRQERGRERRDNNNQHTFEKRENHSYEIAIREKLTSIEQQLFTLSNSIVSLETRLIELQSKPKKSSVVKDKIPKEKVSKAKTEKKSTASTRSKTKK